MNYLFISHYPIYSIPSWSYLISSPESSECVVTLPEVGCSVKAFVAELLHLMSLICIEEGVILCKMYAYNQLKYIQMSDTAMTLWALDHQILQQSLVQRELR